ncbi:unnamed protein product [Symbiodinium pilosum]|uniref:Pentatricopeptide repeat-containing protein, chloroplastic n=1 Tax=Symbiodinium pilosum TaxID=2952 RepID=A0A812UAR4_SYMPI|nr:unnamed protein product [Symbiodinium pilosum]
MRKHRLADVGAFAAVLTACRTGAAWPTSLAILQEARQTHVQPDDICCNAVVSALTRATQIAQALVESQLTLKTPNFNSIIMSLRHTSAAWAYAFDVLAHMQNRRVAADVGTLKAAASICGLGRPDLVLSLFKGLEELRVQPDIIAVNMLMGSLERCHKWQAALHHLHLYCSEGLIPELTTYNSAISACSKAARWAWSMHLADTGLLLRADEITMGSLITACSSQGYWRLALQLLHASKHGGSPSLIAFHSAITACDRAGRWMWSLHLFSDAIASRLTPDVSLLGAVLSGLEKAQHWTRSLALLCRMAGDGYSPDVAVLTSAISACAKAHCWEMALLLTHEVMSHSNLIPNEATAGAALSSLSPGSWQLAGCFLELLRAQRLQQSSLLLEPLPTRCYDRILTWPSKSLLHQGVLVANYIAEDLVDLRDLPPPLAQATMRDSLSHVLLAGPAANPTAGEVARQAQQAFCETAMGTVQGLVEQLGFRHKVQRSG